MDRTTNHHQNITENYIYSSFNVKKSPHGWSFFAAEHTPNGVLITYRTSLGHEIPVPQYVLLMALEYGTGEGVTCDHRISTNEGTRFLSDDVLEQWRELTEKQMDTIPLWVFSVNETGLLPIFKGTHQSDH